MKHSLSPIVLAIIASATTVAQAQQVTQAEFIQFQDKINPILKQVVDESEDMSTFTAGMKADANLIADDQAKDFALRSIHNAEQNKNFIDLANAQGVVANALAKEAKKTADNATTYAIYGALSNAHANNTGYAEEARNSTWNTFNRLDSDIAGANQDEANEILSEANEAHKSLNSTIGELAFSHANANTLAINTVAQQVERNKATQDLLLDSTDKALHTAVLANGKVDLLGQSVGEISEKINENIHKVQNNLASEAKDIRDKKADKTELAKKADKAELDDLKATQDLLLDSTDKALHTAVLANGKVDLLGQSVGEISEKINENIHKVQNNLASEAKDIRDKKADKTELAKKADKAELDDLKATQDLLLDSTDKALHTAVLANGKVDLLGQSVGEISEKINENIHKVQNNLASEAKDIRDKKADKTELAKKADKAELDDLKATQDLLLDSTDKALHTAVLANGKVDLLGQSVGEISEKINENIHKVQNNLASEAKDIRDKKADKTELAKKADKAELDDLKATQDLLLDSTDKALHTAVLANGKVDLLGQSVGEISEKINENIHKVQNNLASEAKDIRDKKADKTELAKKADKAELDDLKATQDLLLDSTDKALHTAVLANGKVDLLGQSVGEISEKINENIHKVQNNLASEAKDIRDKKADKKAVKDLTDAVLTVAQTTNERLIDLEAKIPTDANISVVKADIARIDAGLEKTNQEAKQAFLELGNAGLAVAKVADQNKKDIATQQLAIAGLQQTDTAQNTALGLLKTDIELVQEDVNYNTTQIGNLKGISLLQSQAITELNQDVVDNAKNIDENKQAIAKKADQDELDALYGAVDANKRAQVLVDDEQNKAIAKKADQDELDALYGAVDANKRAQALIDDKQNKAIAEVEKKIPTDANLGTVNEDIKEIKQVLGVSKKTLGSSTGATTSVTINNIDQKIDTANQRIDSTNQRIDNAVASFDRNFNRLDRKLSAGVASSSAIAFMPTPQAGGHYLTGGTAFFNGQSAVAIGLSGTTATGNISYKLGGSWTSEKQGAFGVGAGWRWK